MRFSEIDGIKIELARLQHRIMVKNIMVKQGYQDWKVTNMVLMIDKLEAEVLKMVPESFHQQVEELIKPQITIV